MKNKFLLVVLLLISGCDNSVKPGSVSNAGVVQYQLCEKSKSRITDLQRVSFELPSAFKQTPCGEWLGYGHSLRSDSLTVDLLGTVANGALLEVGGVNSLTVTGGYEIHADYLTPDIFFEEYREYLSKRMTTYRLVTASWVGWSGGRCARFYSDNDTSLYLLRVLDYFCWETNGETKFPLHLHATQKQAPGQSTTNLDKEFIEPVLSTLQINPLPAERLATWSNERAIFCTRLKKGYDEKSGFGLSDDLDRRRTIRFLRDCGFEMPDPVGVEGWQDLLMPNGYLLGQPVAGDNTLRRLPHPQFAALKEKLMSLQPRLGARPDVRVQGPTKDGEGLVVIFQLNGPYDGEWYKFPPSYSERNGVGLRNDPVLGEVIDVLIRENINIPLGLKLVSDSSPLKRVL
ncbi:hypothetical protein ACVW0Y_004706 [Pseudomonas sp. TE3786]